MSTGCRSCCCPATCSPTACPTRCCSRSRTFGDGTVSANDCFRPVSRYFDRINRPEQLIPALQRAMRVLTDPAECGPVTLAMCQDVQTEAYDWPESLFAEKSVDAAPHPPGRERARRGRRRDQGGEAAADHRRRRRPLFGGLGRAHGVRRDARDSGRRHARPASRRSTRPIRWPSARSASPARRRPTRSPRDADLLLAVGTRLQDFTTGSWALFKSDDLKIVALNVAPYDTAKHDALPLVCDAKVGLTRAVRGARGWKADPAVAERAAKEKATWLEAAGKALASTNAETAVGRAGDRRGRARARRRRHRSSSTPPAACRANCTSCGSPTAPGRLSHGIRLLLHGLRDRRRHRASRWPGPTRRSSSWSATAPT